MISNDKYFDNCATTRTDNSVAELMEEINCNEYFNPSSLNDESLKIFKRINDARQSLKNDLGGLSGNLIFTSCGSEADNTAILGCIKNRTNSNIVTSEVEHPAVYNTINVLKNRGFEIRYAPLNYNGSIDIDKFHTIIDINTQFVSLMHVNNETGAISDIASAVSIAKNINPKLIFMCDGIQAFNKIPINLDNMGVDLYSISGHKFHCCKGIGALWIKQGININPLINGGGQEFGLRNGTENSAGIISLAYASKLAQENLNKNIQLFKDYKNILINELKNIDKYIILCENESAPNIFSVAFKNVKSEVIMHMLEENYGIIVGIGSACSSKHRTNRIMKAINIDKSYHDGLIRISFSKYNNIDSVKYLSNALIDTIRKFRGKL